ncbi:hypothetical protein AGABI1DRAFT_130424 [Agaricus bisporus var. burnettii JB137-S8]|uniref:Uncharacterized protein n=1 Tax=Agaricus bisporus var. burnettii (strain JB137-S8 / ATCC MYA-4627 / FGSC 10392) TaxID=597362 RepID=K5X2F4_AGABU|nr:uncharacterized protein AGABI1DRAFT_130424 [Agaricus bisporus var. burnettii JB137-S8]EKM77338.1 hypothetical protein AGABI1DRAFT_130424 [Agaricus bisporus var. burnettii JB137-S8]
MSSSDKFSNMPEETRPEMMEGEEPKHVKRTDTTSGKYNIVPDPHYARESLGPRPGDTQPKRDPMMETGQQEKPSGGN